MRNPYQKYRAEKTEVDGIKFASKLESARYKQLKLLESAGAISDLKLQVEFQVFKGYINPDTGEKTRSTTYVADFSYTDIENHLQVVEDTKGVETPDFRLKWKLVQSQYPEYVFRKVTRDMV